MKYIKILSCAAFMTGVSFGSAFASCALKVVELVFLLMTFRHFMQSFRKQKSVPLAM